MPTALGEQVRAVWFLATAAAGGEASGPLLFVQLFVANRDILLPINDNVRKITQCQVARNVKRCFGVNCRGSVE